jgi:hypothetical protein
VAGLDGRHSNILHPLPSGFQNPNQPTHEVFLFMKRKELKIRPATVFVNEQLSFLPKTKNLGGHVYIFVSGNKMKVGKSIQWQKREQVLSASSGVTSFDVRVVTIEHSNYSQNEVIMLQKLKNYQITSEWFNSDALTFAIDTLKTLIYDTNLKISEITEDQRIELATPLAKVEMQNRLNTHISLLHGYKEWLDQGDLWEFQKQLIRDKNFRISLESIIKEWKIYLSESIVYKNLLEEYTDVGMSLYLTETIIRFKQMNDVQNLNLYLCEGAFPTHLLSKVNNLFNAIQLEMDNVYIKELKRLEELY